MYLVFGRVFGLDRVLVRVRVLCYLSLLFVFFGGIVIARCSWCFVIVHCDRSCSRSVLMFLFLDVLLCVFCVPVLVLRSCFSVCDCPLCVFCVRCCCSWSCSMLVFLFAGVVRVIVRVRVLSLVLSSVVRYVFLFLVRVRVLCPSSCSL